MNIAITGASGFVGKNLTTYLSGRNNHVLPVARKGKTEVDISVFQEQNIHAIIHLAGKAHDLKNVSQPQEYYEANNELTKKIFDQFIHSSAEVFVFMSSVKAVADVVENVLIEDDIPHPETHYGKSKRLAEKYILETKIPPHKRVYILRPCMIHGPANKGNLNLLYQFAKKGLPWPLGAFKNKRSFCSVENLCFVVNELLQNKNIPSGIYNIADDEPLATNDLIALMASTLGKKPKIWNLPKRLIKAIAKAGDKLKLPLNSERLQKLTENYVVSNEKLLKAIGKPLPLTAREGLLKTFNSFQ